MNSPLEDNLGTTPQRTGDKGEQHCPAELKQLKSELRKGQVSGMSKESRELHRVGAPVSVWNYS